MSIHRLKTSKPETEKREDDEKVRSTVESILADIEKRGDVSVRELSKKFDAYEPVTFLLNESKEMFKIMCFFFLGAEATSNSGNPNVFLNSPTEKSC